MSSSNRQPYLTATVLNQDFLNDCHDNLVCQLEVAIDIQTPDGFIYASDRNKYVGGIFYEALLKIPTITRTVGDWLAPQLEFSELNLELSNADGRFNKYAAGGDSFDGWIGKTVEVKIGLRDVESTYTTVFSGVVTEVGGFGRTIKSLIIRARDNFSKLSKLFPTQTFSSSVYPQIENFLNGANIPLIYGDWTTNTNAIGPSVPAFCMNGKDPYVLRFEGAQVQMAQGDPVQIFLEEHNFQLNDEVIFTTDGTLPTPLVVDTKYFVFPIDEDIFSVAATANGTPIEATDDGTGNHRIELHEDAGFRNAKFVITTQVLPFLSTAEIQIRRGELRVFISENDIINVVDNNSFEIVQNQTTVFDGEPLKLLKGDQIFVRVKGILVGDLGQYNDNIVEQARHILLNHANAVASDFDSTWDYYRDKSSPAESNIAVIKSRVWIQDQQSVIEYVLSLLEQVRLEIFVSRERKLSLASLHFDEFNPTPNYTIRPWDIERESLRISIDERLNFNRVRAAYAFLPDEKQNGFFSSTIRNNAAIAQAGREISRQLVYPNLYFPEQVERELKEVLKITSSYLEKLELNLTWRSILLEIGTFVKINSQIGSAQFNDVPCLIRTIGYDAVGFRVRCIMWSFQMTPFTGYNPDYAGTVGGQFAILTEENA